MKSDNNRSVWWLRIFVIFLLTVVALAACGSKTENLQGVLSESACREIIDSPDLQDPGSGVFSSRQYDEQGCTAITINFDDNRAAFMINPKGSGVTDEFDEKLESISNSCRKAGLLDGDIGYGLFGQSSTDQFIQKEGAVEVMSLRGFIVVPLRGKVDFWTGPTSPLRDLANPDKFWVSEGCAT